MQHQADNHLATTETTDDQVISSSSSFAFQKAALSWEERILIVRRHFERKGYRVHSGLQFGTELVLYADTPGRVHSDFCVHVLPEGKVILLYAPQVY